MIDKETLKKHNLKSVPFSCIGEGESFHLVHSIRLWKDDFEDLKRKLIGDYIYYADTGQRCIGENKPMFESETVYVPVWRVTN